MKRALAVATAVTALLTLAGCTRSTTVRESPTSTVVTGTTVVTETRTVTPPATPNRASTVHPLPPGTSTRKGETEASCPYIKPGLNIDDGSGVNLADLEGDRIYRVTRLTRYTPVGCRFYFYAPPYEAVADIRPQTYANATQARNAMILTARTGTELITERNFVKGLDGICFRTRYFGPDGARDWAFVFAKGNRMIGVYTQRNDTSRNALYIAQAIAAKF